MPLFQGYTFSQSTWEVLSGVDAVCRVIMLFGGLIAIVLHYQRKLRIHRLRLQQEDQTQLDFDNPCTPSTAVETPSKLPPGIVLNLTHPTFQENPSKQIEA